MGLSREQRIISADDHMDVHVLPPTLFQERLPREFRDAGPRVVDTDDGPFWQAEGKLVSPSGRKAAGYIRSEAHGFRPGQPEARLEDMDRDGVYAQIIYSPMTTQLQLQEPLLRAACLRAYNDWAAEFNGVAPSRLLLLSHLPSHEPKAARDELERVARLGHRGAILGQMEAPEPIFGDSWRTFWDAANEIGIPIHAHLGPPPRSIQPKLGSWRMPAMVAIIPMQLDEALVGMVMSGMLEQRPNVKFVLGEGGLGWVPYVIERMDHEHHKYYDKTQDHRLSMLPSEIFHRQVYATYEDEDLGVRLIPEIGADNVMWASDYPHGDSTWPNSRKVLAESPLAKLGDDVLRKVICDNAARVYGIG
jgi:predicted TIM-barrel fold metal-dependent hydrolase